jgi:hypothetical protein
MFREQDKKRFGTYPDNFNNMNFLSWRALKFRQHISDFTIPASNTTYSTLDTDHKSRVFMYMYLCNRSKMFNNFLNQN